MVNKEDVCAQDWLGFDWSPWLTLHPDHDELEALSTDPGLYRVRHPEYGGLVYIGETGRSLRGRVLALRRGIYDDEMPYSDPHPGSPSFWAIIQRHGTGFEVSGATPQLATDSQHRKGIEDALIALHRRETGTNLIGNFGRMPPGFSKSKRRSSGERGSRSDDDTLRSFRRGVDPLSWKNAEDAIAPDWMGLDWSDPRPLEDALNDIPDTGGVYRIWDDDWYPPLEYIGESTSLKRRLRKHRRNRDGNLLFSFATLPELDEKFQLSQVESELLGAHWLAYELSPRDQY